MVDRICELIKKKGMSISAVEKQLGFGNGAIKRFEKNSPSIDKVISLSNFLNVSIDYLVYGKDHLNNTNISNSNIVDHSHGTITINSSSVSKEPKTKTENVPEQTVINETTKELIEVFESLPTRERVRLLNMVYDFEEQYRKSNT